MKKISKWMKKLTGAEIRHIAETSSNGKPTLRSLKLNLQGQKEIGCECHECLMIAAKLGLQGV